MLLEKQIMIMTITTKCTMNWMRNMWIDVVSELLFIESVLVGVWLPNYAEVTKGLMNNGWTCICKCHVYVWQCLHNKL